MPSIILHLLNEDPIVGEIDDLPGKSDYIFTVKNPRRKDGKDLPYVEPNVNTLLIPVFRVSFIEVLSEKEEEIITFVRE
jgi:hypothetical protein